MSSFLLAELSDFQVNHDLVSNTLLQRNTEHHAFIHVGGRVRSGEGGITGPYSDALLVRHVMLHTTLNSSLKMVEFRLSSGAGGVSDSRLYAGFPYICMKLFILSC